jgi:hypothetical protein
MDYQYKSVYDGLNQNEMLNSNRNLIIGKKQNNTNLFSNDTTNQSSIINSYNFDYKNQNNKINNCINVTENESNENYNYSPCKNNTINLNSPVKAINDNPTFRRPTENYINNLKTIYELDKQQLIEENREYKLQNESEKNKLTDKILFLENKVKSLQDKNKLDSKAMIDQFNFNIKKLTKEKDDQIQLLVNKNSELTQCNEELINKLNKYLDIINVTKINLGAQISNLECENDRLKKENENMKYFYENKIKYYENNLEDEKNKLIYGYENQIQELKNNYDKSKESFKKMMDEREIDIKKLIDNNQIDLDRLSKLNINYKNQIDQLNEEKINLLKQNEEQKFTIQNLQNSLDKSNKEGKQLYRQKTITEEKLDKVERENNDLKNSNDALNRITYGRFKKLNTFTG